MGAPRFEDEERIETQTLFETMGLNTANRFAVVRDPSDGTSLIGYYATFASAQTAQQANLGPNVPTIVINEDHADLQLDQSESPLANEWYDADHPNVWWR